MNCLLISVQILVLQNIIFSAHGFLFFDWKFFQKAIGGSEDDVNRGFFDAGQLKGNRTTDSLRSSRQIQGHHINGITIYYCVI